jgi:hypothetical protein
VKTAGLEQVVSTAAQHVQTALQQGEHIPSLLCTRVVGSKRACIPPKRHFVSLTHSLAPPSACLLCALLSSLLLCAHLRTPGPRGCSTREGSSGRAHPQPPLHSRGWVKARVHSCAKTSFHSLTLTRSLPSPLRSCSPPCCCARICAHHDTHPSRSRRTLAWRHNPRGARR